MTINDTPEVRKISKIFRVKKTQLKYSMSPTSGSRSKLRTELLIINYD